MRIIMLFLLVIVPPHDINEKLILMDNEEIVQTIERKEYMIDLIGPPLIQEKKLTNLAKKMNDLIYKAPTNAFLNDIGEIVEEMHGLKLDQAKFYQLFYKYFYENYPTRITIPKIKVYPRINSELLSVISERRISSYATYYKESNEERSHNISLSTEAINNYVVFPGEKFSFNKVVGERTEAKGYKKAPVIVKGEFTEDIGGGICQVSSTLYNAVILKGIEIVERYSHSRSVPYVPPGKDATVSWWGPDFVFKNNYNQPILIRAFAKNGVMSVEIFSAEDVTF